MDQAVDIDRLSTLNLLASDADTPPQRRPARHRMARAGWFLAIVAVLAVAVPFVSIHYKRQTLLSQAEQRLSILARGRAEVVETWLEGLARPVDRVVNSEMFRLFATEVDFALGDVSDLAAGKSGKSGGTSGSDMSVPLTAQIPFMAQVLTDFVKAEGLIAGHLIDRNGDSYVASGTAPELAPTQKTLAIAALKSGVLRYGPVRATAAGLVLDIFAPILSAQSGTDNSAPVAVALLSLPVSLRIAQILAPPPLSEPGERLRLLQVSAEGAFEVAPGELPPLRPAAALSVEQISAGLSFMRRTGLSGGTVYSVGAPVAGPAWWIVQELDAEALSQRMGGYIAAVVTMAVLSVLAVAAVFGAFWWRLANEHSAALAEQYRRLAARIEAQKHLLDSINNTITDHIGLKALDGTYRYVNPAFAKTIGKDVNQALGLDDAAIFGQGTAARLKLSDQRALTSGAPVTVSEDVYLGPKPHHLQITKVPYRDESGVFAGIVSVTRDVTELVEEQRKTERAIRQTVAALVRAVELRDPYLAGHSRRVASFAAAVGQRLGIGQEEAATLEIAANLSQIGKLGIPRELLGKPSRLTAAELKIVQGHLDHAAKLLGDIDFGLPVLDTIMAMHERLDGGGYPKGLTGERIAMTARILGACDVFCARLEPRSYRRGIKVAAALKILTENEGRYDPRVVAALRDVAESVAGEKLLADLKTR
jgi:PAS domain S-box-containing protein